MLLSIFFAALLMPNFITCWRITDSSTESLVISYGYPPSKTSVEPDIPELKSMHVTANIRNRYARTTVETKYLNPKEQSQEATFTITLPDTAFISGFVMEIGEKKYEAYVKEKEEAKKEYEQAVARGQSAGHVAMSARDSNIFTVSVNVEPLSKILFTLTYEQLLIRKHGKYEMVINLHPGQLVDDFNVDVNIHETKRIVDVSTPAIRPGNEIADPTKVTKNEYATISNGNENETEFNIHFTPSKQEQQEMMVGTKGADESKGLSGQFVVEYDVERDPEGGEVIFGDGYFVHFFAPSDLPPIPKHIVFVLDVSGSMMGKKIKQLREAMTVILGELNSEDHFHLVKFSTWVQIWNGKWENINNPSEAELPPPYLASEENIEKAQEIVAKMRDEGMTNIYDALQVALRLTSKGVSNLDNEIQPIIVFLTDGQANQGISDYKLIQGMVDSRNDEKRAAIFALSFGDAANKDFLKEIASKNIGLMRTIYEAADASLQLEDFYREISSPLLKHVNFIYTDEVSNVTKNKFDILFKGGELVVAGKLTDSAEKFVDVEARTVNGTHNFLPCYFQVPKPPKPEQKKEYGSLERLWAYLTIKQLLQKRYDILNTEENPKKEALAIALKYSFVTPVSSLIVVKPNSTESLEPIDLQKPRDVPDYVHQYQPRPMLSSRPAISSYNVHQYQQRPMLSSRISSDNVHQYQQRPILPTSITSALKPSGRSRSRSRTSSSTLHLTKLYNPIQDDLPFIRSYLSGPDTLIIKGELYFIGNNETAVDNVACQVDTLNLFGNCTLLSACPKIYPTLDTLDTYLKYFCTLDSKRYAGTFVGGKVLCRPQKTADGKVLSTRWIEEACNKAFCARK